MGKYTNPHARLSELISIMSSEKYMDEDDNPTLTIRMIAEITEIPEIIIKKDMETLLSDHCMEEKFLTEKGSGLFLNMLQSGRKEAADMKFMFDYESLIGYEKYEERPVFLTPFEKNIFAKVMHMSDISDAIWVKDSVFSIPEEVGALKNEIRIAIENNNPISFHYASQKGEEDIDCLNVCKLYETVDNKKIYCIAIDEEMRPLFYRLERMSSLKIEKDKSMPPIPENAMNFLDHIWGADASSAEGEAFHVKVKILKDTKNLLSKIESDTRDRKYGKLYDDEKDENIAYYEDDIIGSNSFKKWLRRYGASVVVLEPLWLAEEMYQSAVKRMEAYKRFV